MCKNTVCFIIWFIICFITLKKDVSCKKCVSNTFLNNSEYNPENKVTAIPKCCGKFEKLVREFNKTFCKSDETINYFKKSIYRHNGTGHRPVAIGDCSKLVILVNNNCKKQMLNRNVKDDTSLVIENGIHLYMPFKNKHFHIGEYCLDFYEKNNSTGINTFLCVPKPPEPIALAGFDLHSLGLIISVPFLIITIVIYVKLPELNDLQGKCLSLYSGCLAVAFSALAFNKMAPVTLPDRICVTVARIIQFSFVSCFFWLNSMCIETWLNVKYYLKKDSTPEEQRRRFFWYSICSWSFPLLLIIVTLILEHCPFLPESITKPHICGQKKCWFDSTKDELPYFYAPIATIICVNMILFILTAKELAGTITNTKEIVRDAGNQPERFIDSLDFKFRWRKYKKLFRLYSLLFTVMGLNWSVEILSCMVENKQKAIWTVFDIINAMQGVIIFGIFVCQRSVRKLVIHRVRRVVNKKEEHKNMACFSCRRNTSAKILGLTD